MYMSENKTEVKARIMPAEDGSIKVVFFSAPTSPPLLGAKAASGAKNAPVEDVTVAESGAEAPLDESILKQDPAAEEATAAETVDSDRAKATFAAHKPRANAVFWSKFERPTDPPPAHTEDAPALEPVAKVATAVKPAAAGGETLPSIKEFPEEEPAPAGDADVNVSTKEFPEKEPAPAGLVEWKTPSPLRKIERKGESNLVDRSKKTTKNLTPTGRVDPNRFAALLGTDVDEEDIADVGSGNAFDDKEDVAGVGSGAPPSSTTPSGAGEETEPTSTRSGLRFGGTFCSTSKLLCVFLTVAIGLGCSAFALSSYGSGGVSDLIESVFVPDAASISVLDLSNTTPAVPASTPALMPHLDDRRLNVEDKDDDDAGDDDAEDDDAEDDDKDDDDAEDDDARFSDLRGSDDDDASVSPPSPPPSPPPPSPPPLCCASITANGIHVDPGTNPTDFPTECEGTFTQQPDVSNGRATYKNGGHWIFYTTTGFWTCAASYSATTGLFLKGAAGLDCPSPNSDGANWKVCTYSGGCTEAVGGNNGNFLMSVTCV